MVRYLYNEIELPALPYRDETLYPYAFIYPYKSGQKIWYYVYYLRELPVDVYQPDNILPWYMKLPPDFLECYYKSTTDEWTELKTITSSYNRSAGWANFDIVADNGTIILRASEPVPVPLTTLTARDLYRKINGKPTKLTLYKKLGGKLIPLDEHTKEVKT